MSSPSPQQIASLTRSACYVFTVRLTIPPPISSVHNKLGDQRKLTLVYTNNLPAIILILVPNGSFIQKVLSTIVVFDGLLSYLPIISAQENVPS